jgi:hypothetical protein
VADDDATNLDGRVIIGIRGEAKRLSRFVQVIEDFVEIICGPDSCNSG